jgi:hypothetical protein
VRSGSGEDVSNKFYWLTHHNGEARCKTRMFKRLNGSSQRCQVFRIHAWQVKSPTTLINASLRQLCLLARRQARPFLGNARFGRRRFQPSDTSEHGRRTDYRHPGDNVSWSCRTAQSSELPRITVRRPACYGVSTAATAASFLRRKGRVNEAS